MSLMAANEESDSSAILNGFWVTLMPEHCLCRMRQRCGSMKMKKGLYDKCQQAFLWIIKPIIILQPLRQ